MNALLYKVYCYRGSDKQIWFEVEDRSTGQGVAWSPSKLTVVNKARKLGAIVNQLINGRRIRPIAFMQTVGDVDPATQIMQAQEELKQRR